MKTTNPVWILRLFCLLMAVWISLISIPAFSLSDSSSNRALATSEYEPASRTAVEAPITSENSLSLLGISDDYPIMFINRNGKPDGLAVDLLESFALEAGYDLALTLVTSDQYNHFAGQSFDLYYNSRLSGDLFQNHMTLPFHISNYVLFVDRRKAGFVSASNYLQQTSGKQRVGFRESRALSQYLGRVVPAGTLVGKSHYDAVLEDLLSGRTDAALMPSDFGQLLLREQQITSVQALETVLFLEENSFIVSPDQPLLQFELNRYIQALKKSGELPRLVDTWITRSRVRSEAQERLNLFNYFFLISAVATFIFSYRSYHLERSLENKAAELQALNQANEDLWTALIDEESYKNEYFINLSHELRTPLSLILNAVNAVERSAAHTGMGPGDEKLLKYTGIARNNSLRLLRVINNLIDASHLEHNEYTLDLKPVDLVQELNELFKYTLECLEPGELSLELQSPFKNLEVVVDPYELDRVLLNLISNTVKFNDHAPQIRLSLSTEGDVVHLDYADNSRGIPKAHILKAFEKYHQLDSEFTKKAEGAGFGLYLAKHLIELHEGHLIPLCNEALTGMRYSIQLPLKRANDLNRPSSGKSLFYDRARLVRLELSEIRSPSK